VDGRQPAAGISEALELRTLILIGLGLIAFGTVLSAGRYRPGIAGYCIQPPARATLI